MAFLGAALRDIGSAAESFGKKQLGEIKNSFDPTKQKKDQAQSSSESPQQMVDTTTSPQMNQLPMYAQGGDVPKDQVAHVDAGERVLNPAEAHAYRASAAGNAPPTLIGRIADRFHELYNQGAALVSPMNSEADALKEKQQNVNAAQHQMAAENKPLGSINYAPVASDQVHPGAAYGSHPGEQRIDTSSMTKPLGAAPASAPVGKLPSYRMGGDVEEDQVAKLDAGEHVLDPKKAELYRQAEEEVKAEHGAPADFAGQVMPNPKGIEVKGDTDQEKPDYKLQGARMQTENAPLKKSQMDTSNPPSSDAGNSMEREASTNSLGKINTPRSTQMKNLPGIETPKGNGTTDVPYTPAAGEASARAAGYTVQHQAPNPEHAAPPAPPEEAAPDPMEIARQTIKQDQLDAMKQGPAGLMNLGTSKIHENMLTPAYTGTERIGKGTPGEAQLHKEFQDKVGDLTYKMKNAPTRLERAQAEQELAELKRKTPWSSPENHPGMLGKILHGVSSVAQGVGQGAIPTIMPMIPGSQANLAASEARGEQGVEQAQKKEATTAETALKSAQAVRATDVPPAQQLTAAQAELRAATTPDAKAAAQGKVDDATALLQAGKTQLKESGMSQQYLDAETELANAKTPADKAAAQSKMDRIKNAAGMALQAKPETAEADKLSYEATVGKLNHSGFSTKPEDIPKSLSDALKAGKITQIEADQAAGFREGNPPASTKIEISNAETANKASSKKAGSYYTYSDAEGTHLVTGDKLPPDVESTPIKDSAAFIREAEAGNIVQESMNKIAQDVHEHPEVFDNATSRNILATTLEQIDRQAAGLLVAGTGGQIPLPSGMGDMINTALQNNSLDKKTGEALRNYIADYKSMKDKAIVQQMAMQGGKIGRASQVALQAIINQIPNGSTPDSKTANRQMSNLQQTQDDLMKAYPNKYGNYEKAKPYVARDAGGVPVNADVPVYAADGKTLIGHGVNGKYVPLEKK